MSSQLGKVVSLILIDRFGPVVERVGTSLYQFGSSPLLHIKKRTDLPISKIKESLTILIKYQLATFAVNQNENIANYSIDTDKVLLMLRYPKYINIIKKKFGDSSEMIVEECLQRSYITASEVILKVHERLTKNEESIPLSQLKNEFISLVNAKYLIRLPVNEAVDKPVPKLVEQEIHTLPPVDLILLQKFKAGEAVLLPDKDIYWHVNFDRFHQDMRDKIIISAFTKKFDENAGELVKILLQQMYIRTDPWADVTNPIPILEIKDLARKQKNLGQLNAFFDQYVNVIEQDHSNLIRKSGEASGGSFQIYLKDAYKQFAWELIEQCIMEKFDSKAARIFRLVKLKQYIEPNMIQKLVMIPAKEAKRLTYQLYEENFLHIQELRKQAVGGGGPSKLYTLFHIKLELVARMILELCYKTLFNIMTRRNHDKSTNKRIIDKKQRVDTITLGMRSQGAEEEQLAEIEEMITPPEKEIIARIEKNMKKLNTIELEIDDTIFLLQMYLMYN